MNLPNLSKPVNRSLSIAKVNGVNPSGDNTQCCSGGCMTTYCLIGLSSKGCRPDGTPYINCIGG